MPKTKTITAMPGEAELDKLRLADTGYMLASTDPVAYLDGRKQAVYNISRGFRLDPEELYQEGYEILLTCLRDYSPVLERGDKFIKVQFTTFFGNRLEGRAMEMRNRDPEYQARQAFTDGMDDGEKKRFKEDPPLLVQHLDHESPMQEMLRGEASEARESGMAPELKILRDSFFEKKLDQLIAAERDDKKRAILMHVKLGGVYNFQEIAYHFGVTDSRASQIMNELMDAFYVQRLLQGSVQSVAYDFIRLKFNEKRVLRLLEEGLQNATVERQQEITAIFKPTYPALQEPKTTKVLASESGEESLNSEKPQQLTKELPMISPIPYGQIFDAKLDKQYPPQAVEVVELSKLSALNIEFRQPSDQPNEVALEAMCQNAESFPLIINAGYQVIDGWRRVQQAQQQGLKSWPCQVRQVKDERAAKVLRVLLNIRLQESSKVDLYFAIGALEQLGLAQQKVADVVKISRTNVIVYSKLKNKGSKLLQDLFTDELIQITNASSCTDLPHELQDQLAQFIRDAGVQWSKGSQFTSLHDAANSGRLDEFITKHAPQPIAGVANAAPVASTSSEVPAPAGTVHTERLAAYEQALRDAEVWAAQRESVINRQTEELVQAFGEIDKLKREVDAAELSKFGSPEAMESMLSELREYFAVSERVVAATSSIERAAKDLRKVELRRKQHLELAEQLDQLEQQVNQLRVALVAKGPTPVQAAPKQNMVEEKPKTTVRHKK